MDAQEQQGTEATRVQLVSQDFQVWMECLGTRGLQDPEANLAPMAITAHEVIQDSLERADVPAQEASQALRGNVEKKEILCSFLVALKAFRETEGTQDFQDYRDLGVPEVHQAPSATQESRGSQDFRATLGAPV